MRAGAGTGGSRVRRLIWATVLLTSAFVATAAASAATVELRGERLLITGDSQRDRLQLERRADMFRVRQLNRDAGLVAASASCQSSGTGLVECSASEVERIRVSTGPGNDRFAVGPRFPASDERGSCARNELGGRLTVRLGEGSNYAELSRGDDLVVGGDRRDVLLGCQGDDEVRGRGGADRLSGDRGNDSIRGGKGSDWLIGCVFDPDDPNYPRDEPGNDALRGGRGSDFLYGCRGVDHYRAGRGDDVLNARDGRGERLGCGRGTDLVYVDPSDRLRSCERQTECTTDNFPFFPCSRGSGARTPPQRQARGS